MEMIAADTNVMKTFDRKFLNRGKKLRWQISSP